ncbi:MAG: hypothetical protein ACI9UA_002026 [Pseudoalteromonas tetraodonis]|jgi:hypothetical protein
MHANLGSPRRDKPLCILYVFQRMQSSRRQFLRQSACGFGGLALADMLNGNPLAPRTTPAPPRAKRVIFIWMQGGPSQVDTFDHKPRLERHNGEKLDFFVPRTRKMEKRMVLGSPWKFRQHGQSGRWVSELFPHIAGHVDDLCFIHSMHTEGVAHGPSSLFLHTGATNLVRPSMGAWVNYGLGTENDSLPGFVTVSPPPTKGGPRNYSNAFLPPVFQGTALGRAGQSARDARFKNVTNKHLGATEQRRQFDFLQALNREQSAGDATLEATIDSYELAFRMQAEVPDVMDMRGESAAVQQLYGIGDKTTDEFGRQCLTARKLAEAGVRYVQINYADTGATPRWDQHSNIKQHAKHAAATDKPVAGLLQDLKARGLLEDTLVWWGGEFGRTPFSQGTDGRDHNPRGFTVWLAGGGTKAGHAHGATDEFGHEAVLEKVHMHDLHATILHLLGLDHEQLTYRHAGRDFRLTDVYGEVVDGIIG